MSGTGAPTVVMLPQCSFLSEVSRALLIGEALQQRGADVVFATRGGTFAHLLDDAGHAVRRLDPASAPESAHRFLNAILNMGPGKCPDFYTDADLRTAIDAEIAMLREVDADLVVTGFALSTYISTKVAGVPLATDHGGSFVPPVLAHNLCPAPVNSPDPGLARLPVRVQRWLANKAPAMLRGPVRQLNRHADERGVATLPGMMALMCGDLTLITEVPEVLGMPQAALDQWRPRLWSRVPAGMTYRFTGPLYARLDIESPAHVQAFLSSPGKVVYVSATSVTEPYLRALVDAARGTGMKVLVSSGPHDLIDLADEQVCVAAVLPNHLVMPRVDAAVIMGGQGSVQTAMASGTPFVGLPYHGEQELNVAVAQRLGMAVRMSPAEATTPALGEAIHALLADPSYARAARHAATAYDGVDGAGGAAEAILEWLHARQPQRSSR